MEVIWLAAFILGSGFAIASGQGAKWKSSTRSVSCRPRVWGSVSGTR